MKEKEKNKEPDEKVPNAKIKTIHDLNQRLAANLDMFSLHNKTLK